MNSAILPGVIRRLGRARIKFDSIYNNKKIGLENTKKFLFLEKLNLKDKGFSRTALFKTLKFFTESEPEEVMFWTVLKLINAEEAGGICVSKESLKEFILHKNPMLEPEKSWIQYFESKNAKSILCEEAGWSGMKKPYKSRLPSMVMTYQAIHLQKVFWKLTKISTTINF